MGKMSNCVEIQCDVFRLELLSFYATYPHIEKREFGNGSILKGVLSSPKTTFMVPALAGIHPVTVSPYCESKDTLILLDKTNLGLVYALQPGKDLPENRPYGIEFIKKEHPDRFTLTTVFSGHYLAYHYPFTEEFKLKNGEKCSYYAGYGGHNSEEKKALLIFQEGVVLKDLGDTYHIKTTHLSSVAEMPICTEVIINKNLVVPRTHLVPFM